MAKLRLSRAYIYRGTTYGPGEVEVADDQTAAALAATERRYAPAAEAPAEEEAPAKPAPRRPKGAKAEEGAGEAPDEGEQPKE